MTADCAAQDAPQSAQIEREGYCDDDNDPCGASCPEPSLIHWQVCSMPFGDLAGLDFVLPVQVHLQRARRLRGGKRRGGTRYWRWRLGELGLHNSGIAFLCGHHRGRSGSYGPSRFRIPLQTLQIRSYVSRMLVTQVAILLQTLVDNFFQLGRQIGNQSNGRNWSAIEDRLENQSRALPSEGQRSGRHLIQHSAKRKQIGAGV